MPGPLDNLGPRDTLSSGSNGNRSNRCGTAVHHSEQGTTEHKDTRTTDMVCSGAVLSLPQGGNDNAVADEYVFMSCGITAV